MTETASANLMRGTVDLVVLRTLTQGPMHGFSIARWIRERSSDAVSFEDAALSGWVGATLYYWQPGAGYRALSPAGYVGDGLLRPWRGYWLYAAATDLTLTVPVPNP